ncbi:MAG: hypothetical protein IM600_18660 [Bacteroidetes bacterium]|nr:hypothetical protein [Bacteroidota bacterium]
MEITDEQFIKACEIVRTYLGLKNPQDKVEEEKKLKPIEFVVFFDGFKTLTNVSESPRNFTNIELFCREYEGGLDIMLAYDDDRSRGRVYLGHYNDGVK